MAELRLAGFAPCSRANGPGLRAVLWVQGCDRGCVGCFNPATHDPEGGEVRSVEVVLSMVLAARELETVGVTFSGGEPFQQAVALAELARRLRMEWPDVSLMAFTGFTLETLRGPEAPVGSAALMEQLDLLVDGRFEASRPGEASWCASENQRLLILGRPPLEGVDSSAAVEIHVTGEGEVILSGFPSEALQTAVKRLGQ